MVGKLTDEQIEEVLKQNVLGRIGCYDGNRIYVVPVNYVYDGRFIIAHSAEGMKIQMMRKNPGVCFEVDDMKSFTKWKSVIAWGRYQELTDEWERHYALKLFAERTMYMKISKTAIPPEMDIEKEGIAAYHNIRAVIYRIVIQEKTGRFEND